MHNIMLKDNSKNKNISKYKIGERMDNILETHIQNQVLINLIH